MAHDEFREPDVSAYVARMIAMARSTRKRIANSAASGAEETAIARIIGDGLRTSRRRLATRSDPFTVDSIGGQSRKADTDAD